MSNLFKRGFASMPMSKKLRGAFGPGGRGMRWMNLAPDGLSFHIPLHPDGEWKFFSGGPYRLGKDPTLDRELQDGLAPLARELALESLGFARHGDPTRDYRLLYAFAVKSFDGFGADEWHTDEQQHRWDARVVGVMPFALAPPTLVYDQGVAFTPPTGNLVYFEAHRYHKGISTPGQPRALVGADFKAPLLRRSRTPVH